MEKSGDRASVCTETWAIFKKKQCLQSQNYAPCYFFLHCAEINNNIDIFIINRLGAYSVY